MSIKTTEAKLYYALYDFFEAEGFRLLIDKKQFRKSTPAGFVNIIFQYQNMKKIQMRGLKYTLVAEMTK